MASSLKVLIVDDSIIDQKLASASLRGCGYETITSGDGLLALEELRRGGVDFVLTDMLMPGLNGLELVRRIGREFPKVPVIVMTAHGSEEIAVEALKAGATSYVPKRLLNEQLPDALHQVEQASRSLRAARTVQSVLEHSEQRFVLGYDEESPMAVVNYLVEGLKFLNFSDNGGLLHIMTALIEAIRNAIDHGNLELNSALRENGTYRAEGEARSRILPYRDRKVTVTATIDAHAATYVITDQGSGFDPSMLPDPRDPENLLKASGRGVMLIRTFMDHVDISSTERGTQLKMTKRRST